MAYNVPNPVTAAAVSEIWAPPLSPSAVDDEFDSNTLNAAWTRSYVVSATPISPITGFGAGDTREDINGFRKSWMRLQPPADSANKFIHKPFSPAGALPNGLYIARLGFSYRFGSIANTDGSIALQLSATAVGIPDLNNRITVYLNESDVGVVSPQADVINGGVATSVSLPDQENTGTQWEYIAIIRNGNSFPSFLGTRQGSWTWITNLTYTGIPTIDRITLLYSNAASGSPGNQIGKWDFFRYFTSQDLP